MSSSNGGSGTGRLFDVNSACLPVGQLAGGRRLEVLLDPLTGDAAGDVGVDRDHVGSLALCEGDVRALSLVAAAVTYSPGLRRATHKASLNGVISSCSVFTEPVDGTGAISATLSGRASYDAENFTVTFTITWPASSGLSPSVGSLQVVDSGGTETFSVTVTSGAFPQGLLSLSLITTSHVGTGTKKSPVTSQLFTSTQPLAVSQLLS